VSQKEREGEKTNLENILTYSLDISDDGQDLRVGFFPLNLVTYK